MPNASGLRGDPVGVFFAISFQLTPTRPCCGNRDGRGRLTEISIVSPCFKSKRFSHGAENCMFSRRLFCSMAELFASLSAIQSRTKENDRMIERDIARLRLMHRYIEFIAPHVRNKYPPQNYKPTVRETKR